ncbi:MAG: hypothetical protein ACOYYI_12745 [Chloroflexota bacterium]
MEKEHRLIQHAPENLPVIKDAQQQIPATPIIGFTAAQNSREGNPLSATQNGPELRTCPVPHDIPQRAQITDAHITIAKIKVYSRVEQLQTMP